MCAKNEEWIAGLTLRAALMWHDAIVVLDNGSTDRTAEIIREVETENQDRVFLLSEPGQWEEMRHRNSMLETARAHGATHITIVDLDEIVTGNLLPSIRQSCLLIGTDHILQLPLYNMRGSAERYHANGLWGNRTGSIAFADDPALHWGGDRFHHREPMGKRLAGYQDCAQGAGGIMHLWGVSERRLIARHALYKVTERLRWPEKDVRQIEFTYNQFLKGSVGENPQNWTFAQTPPEWWAPYAHLMHHLHVDAEPWQEEAVRDAVAEHGRERFAGLDLFGVVE